MKDDKILHIAEGPILLLGGSGMLGRAWIDLMRSRQIPFEAPTSSELDISDEEQVAEHLAANFTAVINCAAYTDVDGAESSPADAFKVNARGAGLVAEQCAKFGLPLVHYSSDYVFDGRNDKPYGTNHRCNPLNEYGRSKLIGEVAVNASQCHALIIRTSWLFAPWGRNFVWTIEERLRAGLPLRVIDDQIGRPTSAGYLAEASLGLLIGGYRGTWHIANNGTCSWYEFAVAIAKEVGATGSIEPCSSAEYPLPAERPRSAVLDLRMTHETIDTAPHWRTELTSTLAKKGAISAADKAKEMAL
jgi:dTDP-4-dehydrorhamnose reductase